MYFGNKDKNAVTLPHSAPHKHAFLEKIKQMSKSKKIAHRKEVALELLHHKLGHRSNRKLIAGDTAIFWKDIELRIYPDTFCTSCQISSMNKKAASKYPLKPKTPIKWVLMDIITETAPNFLTSDTTFLIIFYLLIHNHKLQNFLVWIELMQRK